MRSSRQRGAADVKPSSSSRSMTAPAVNDVPPSELPLKPLRDRLHCAYCKDELTAPPMLMGRNCHHAICSSCEKGFFPMGHNIPIANRAGLQTTCPVCDSPVEKLDRPDDGKKFFEVIQCAKAVVSSFDEFLAAAEKLRTQKDPEENARELTPPPEQQAKPVEEPPKSTVRRKSAASAKKSTKKTPISVERAKPPLQRVVPQPTPQRGKEKRNAKGETPLHAAVIKNKIDNVRTHLANGASPNVQDFAGWTPLHEACSHGFVEMARLLLEAGAKVNVPGGEFNETPLHDAVSSRRKEIVSLLVSFGADPNLRNSAGVCSLDIAAADSQLTKLLKTGGAKRKASTEKGSLPALFEPVLAYSGLTNEKIKNVVRVAKEHKWKKPTDDVHRETNYVVVDCEEIDGVRKAPLNAHTLKACIMGKSMVDYKWLAAIENHEPPTIESIEPWLAAEIRGIPETREGLQRARENDVNMLPPLLEGFHIYVGGPAQFEADDCLGLRKQDFAKVLAAGGAALLHREPDPAKLDAGATKLPYHAINGPLASTGHLILYPKSKKPNICYNMAELKALPVAWMVECIANFRILNPAPFVNSS